MKKLIAACLVMTVLLPWQAQAKTAEKMYSVCSDAETVDAAMVLCHSYIAGALDMYIIVDGIQEEVGGEDLALKFCFPEGGVTYAQTRLIFLKYVRDNPKVMIHNAAGVALQALRETFPCE